MARQMIIHNNGGKSGRQQCSDTIGMGMRKEWKENRG